MAALLVGGAILLMWGAVQVLFSGPVSRWFGRVARGRFGRLLIADASDRQQTVRFGLLTAVGGAVVIATALLKNR